MNPYLLLGFVAGYFLLLLGFAWYTSRNSNNESFFIGNRNSNWMLVAFGMIGTSLSGVTFVSVPGGVGATSFQYFQLVLGFFVGYVVIAYVLLPLYYRLNVTSIYTYLDKRFGIRAHKTGASFFILSRTLGATARLYLVINILQSLIFDKLHIPFVVTAFVILLMILLYTFEGGVKTIVYTDTLQTSGMLLGLVISIIAIMSSLNLSIGETSDLLRSKHLSDIFNWDVNHPRFFLKQVIGGAVITIAMTGLDQEMMQKNISVNNLKNSQKNMMSFSTVLLVVNLLFLFLGGLLYLFAAKNGITAEPDELFPKIVFRDEFSTALGIIFIIALISALFPSVDGAITALTSSFCIDILGIKNNTTTDSGLRKNSNKTTLYAFVLMLFLFILAYIISAKNGSYIFGMDRNLAVGLSIMSAAIGGIIFYSKKINTRSDEQLRKTARLTVHFCFAVIFFLLVLVFKMIEDKFIIDFIFKIAGFTYGPLLGLFAFGILTKRKVNAYWIPTICIAALLLTFYVDFYNNPQWYQDKFRLSGDFIENLKQQSINAFGGTINEKGKLAGGYKIGTELLLINGVFTFGGLLLASRKK
jgi:Na+/proline symporter